MMASKFAQSSVTDKEGSVQKTGKVEKRKKAMAGEPLPLKGKQNFFC